MAKDAVATMGTILTDDVGGRDAVHVAVIAAEALNRLKPGDHVGIVSNDTKLIVGLVHNDTMETIGIVDPFLENTVQKGQRFWLYLYPRTITSLRHNWTHPAFEDVKETYVAPSEELSSEQWLRNFCNSNDCPGYDTVMSVIKGDHSKHRQWNTNEYLHFNGVDAHCEIPPEFWVHVEKVLGHKVESKPSYFSCAC